MIHRSDFNGSVTMCPEYVLFLGISRGDFQIFAHILAHEVLKGAELV